MVINVSGQLRLLRDGDVVEFEYLCHNRREAVKAIDVVVFTQEPLAKLPPHVFDICRLAVTAVHSRAPMAYQLPPKVALSTVCLIIDCLDQQVKQDHSQHHLWAAT